jgi:hypothetical protein
LIGSARRLARSVTAELTAAADVIAHAAVVRIAVRVDARGAANHFAGAAHEPAIAAVAVVSASVNAAAAVEQTVLVETTTRAPDHDCCGDKTSYYAHETASYS